MRRSALRPGLLFLAFVALGASRRWQEFTCPQVWCEDYVVIQGFAAHGWRSLFLPVNGYLVLAPKLLTGAALALSLPWYPLVSAVFATLFAGLVGLAVATAPTLLHWRTLCAAWVFLVPCDPEVFGLPLYALWWAPILLLLVALWEDESRLGLRLAFVGLGGLSSPLIFVVLPVLCARAFCRPRVAAGWCVGAAALGAAAVQARFLLSGQNVMRPAFAALARHVIPKFCGWYLAGNPGGAAWLRWMLGVVSLALVGALLWRGRAQAKPWILAYLWAGCIGAAVLRVDAAVMQPAMAGPRYFFLPFFLLSWILVQLAASDAPGWLRSAAALAAVVAAANAGPVWTRHHLDFAWRDEVRSAPLFVSYRVPIETDGTRENAWTFMLPQRQWQQLGQRAFDHRWPDAERGPTFAYRILGPADLSAPVAPGQVGASVRLAAARGPAAELRLSPAERIQFRSGGSAAPVRLTVVGREGEFVPWLPITPDWVTLEFSNARLGPSFALVAGVPGGPTGEWRPAP